MGTMSGLGVCEDRPPVLNPNLNTRLHEWRARRCQAVIDVRHGCGVTAASVDSRDCQVGAIKGNLRVALDVQLQRTTGRDGAFRSSYKGWP